MQLFSYRVCICNCFPNWGCTCNCPYIAAQVLRKQGGPLDSKLARAVAIAVTRGMAYLHGRSPAMLHLDLCVPALNLACWHCNVPPLALPSF